MLGVHNQIHLTVKSVTLFAEAKKPPLLRQIMQALCFKKMTHELI
jgi:hypothetical protein